MSNSLKLQILPSKVAVITIDKPDSKFNVLSTGLMNELESVLDQLAKTPNVVGLVIISGKEGSFFAGADLKEIVPLQTQPQAVAFEATQRGKAIFGKIAALPYRTVAAVNGLCLGGGTELTLFCSHRLASDSKSTKLGLPEVGLGFIPGWGGTVNLPRLIGAQAAMELILQPMKSWDARTAWKNGMVDEVVPADKLLARAVEVALGANPKRASRTITQRLFSFAMEGNRLGRYFLNRGASAKLRAETKGNYPAPVAALKVVMAALTKPRAAAFEMESRAFGALASTEVSRAMVSLELAKQDSRKAPNNARAHIDVREVGVLGAGIMGSGIAQAALYAGFKVVLYDKFQQGLERGKKTIAGMFDTLVERGKLKRAEADALMANLTCTLEYPALANCDLVIEAIVEDMDAKKGARAELEKVIQKPFIFATNTSSLSVSKMAEGARDPGNVGGLHFFNPVHKMTLVEVIAGAQTSHDTIATLKSVAGKLNKTAVTSADSPAFIVNRVLATYLFEAIKLMEQGVPFKDLEDAMKRFGFPMGPLALIDEIGLDTSAKVIHVLHAAFGDRFKQPAIIDFFEKSKLLGKKGGKGLYLYDQAGQRLDFNPEVVAAIKAAPSPKKHSEIQDRLVLPMVNEAARCIEENVASDAAQLDLAMALGIGFPYFRGGVLRFADNQGLRAIVQKLDYLSQASGDNYKATAYLRRKAEAGETFYA